MKKFLISMLCVIFAGSMLVACGGGNNNTPNSDTSDRPPVSDSIPDESDTSSDSTSDTSDEVEKTYTITFKQKDCEDIIKTLKKGEVLTDIPVPKTKTGYTVVWDTTNFKNISGDFVVNAIETVKTYNITLKFYDGTTQSMTVKYGSAYELPKPKNDPEADFNFDYWHYNNEKVELEGIWNIDVDGNDITLEMKMAQGWTGTY